MFTTKSHITIDIAAMLRAWKYHGNGKRTTTAEMSESTGISVCISTPEKV